MALIESERSVVTYQGKDTEKKIVRFEKLSKGKRAIASFKNTSNIRHF